MLQSELIPAVAPRSHRLMIVLHALGDDVASLHWLRPAMNLPWLNYLFVNGPIAYDHGYSWFNLSNPDAGLERSRHLLTTLLNELVAKDYPAELITLVGYSQGSLVAAAVGLSYPWQLAGIVAFSGPEVNAEKLLRARPAAAPHQRILLIHGTAGPQLAAHERAQIPLMTAAGVAVTWRAWDGGGEASGAARFAVFRDFVTHGYTA